MLKNNLHIKLSACFLVFSFMCLLIGRAGADENFFRQRLGEKMLNTYVLSPRATGLGGAYAAINDGAHGTYQNPATLAALTSHEQINVFGYERVTEAGNSGNFSRITLGGGFNLNTYQPDYYPIEYGTQSFGLTFTHLSGSSEGADSLDSGASRINLAYGKSFNYGRILAGGSVGFLSSHTSDNSGYDNDIQAYTLRGGVIVRVNPEFSLGGVLAFGMGSAEGSQSDNGVTGDYSEREIRVGASWQMTDVWMLALDLSHQKIETDIKDGSVQENEKHEVTRISFGSEYVVMPQTLTARGGIFVETDDWEVDDMDYGDACKANIGLTGGFSYYHDNWEVGTGHEYTNNCDHSHSLNFMLNF